MTTQARLETAKSALSKVAPILGAGRAPYAGLLTALPSVLPFLARQIKRYPVPSAVAAVGVAYLLAKRRSNQSRSERYRIPY